MAAVDGQDVDMTKNQSYISLTHEVMKTIMALSHSNLYPFLYYTNKTIENMNDLIALINNKKINIKKSKIIKIHKPFIPTIEKTLQKNPNYWPVCIEMEKLNCSQVKPIDSLIKIHQENEAFKKTQNETTIEGLNITIKEELVKAVKDKKIEIKDIKKILEVSHCMRLNLKCIRWIKDPKTNIERRTELMWEPTNFEISNLVNKIYEFKMAIKKEKGNK